MQIVILDGHTTNPGDLSWAPLERLGTLTVFDRTPAAEVVARARGADVVLTNKTPLPADVIANLPAARLIGVLATGFNVVDAAAARARGIPVVNVPEYSTPNVAQATFALLLELTNRTGHHDRAVHEGRWAAGPDFCFWDGDLVELAGKTFGIVGHGRIGQAVGRIAAAFGMEVIHARRRAAPGSVTVDELFATADVVSLHCPLSAETQGLVDARRLGLMKATAYLLNTSRGPLVDEAALAAALAAGRIAGAGLDVLSVEPPGHANPLLTAPRCVITPHIAWATRAARERLIATVAANVAAFAAGTPVHVVN
ncbi:MAG: D-2-hydroxyacid dehydrogenase [Planctomycetia bacterium]|nr:D-2-hydroxyacid dehydrogenase [Planctomycetia bacterium]